MISLAIIFDSSNTFKNKQAVMEQFLKVFDESKIIASDIISSGVEIIK